MELLCIEDQFYEATSFNSDLSDWNVSNVTNMAYMFYSTTSFNNDLSNWDVSKVTNMNTMFYGVLSMNNINLRLYFKVLNSQ